MLIILEQNRFCTEDEAKQKYETVIVLSLRGLDLFLKYYFSSIEQKAATSSNKDSMNLEKLEKIFAFDSRFWKFAKDTSVKVCFLFNCLFIVIIFSSFNKKKR